MSGLLRTAGRIGLSMIFVTSGIDLVRHPEGRTKRAADALPGLPELPIIGQLHGATMLLAGTTMAVGILPRLSAVVLALSLIPNTYIGHPFWSEPDAEKRKGQQIHFLKNTAIFGGLLVMAAEPRREPAT